MEDFQMTGKPTYEELEYRVKELEKVIDNLMVSNEANRDDMTAAMQKLDSEATEWKHALESLRESEEHYRSLFENNQGVMLLIDPDTADIVDANPAACSFYGYSREEITDKKISDINMLSEAQVFEEIEQAQSGSRSYFIFRHRLNSGEIRDVEVYSGPIIVQGKKLLYSTIHDISERKQTEEALSFTQFAIDHSPESAFWMGPEARFIYVNEATCRSLGYSREEMLTMTIHDIDPDFPKEIWPDHWKEIKHNGSSVLESNYRTKDGIIVPVEISFNYLEFGGKEYQCAFARDISERKKSEEILQREKEKFRVLVEESPFGVCFIGSNGSYQYINPKFVELFGYTLEDIPTGQEWFKKAYPDEEYRNHVISTWAKDLEDSTVGEARPRIFTVTCKDGSEKVISFKAVMLETESQIVICEDITEKKRLESQLLQAQKMEAIGTLAGGIGHDFNNLLMSIQGRTSLMLMETDDSHHHLEHLESIEEYVKSAADLTRQLLGIARGGKYEVKATDLNDLIKKSSRMFRRTKKEITIRGKYMKDIWAVEIDRGQIEQVLLNLYINAWQSMPGGGKLSLETENVILGQDDIEPYRLEPGNYVKISVADTGIGMDEATQKRIFDPFFTTKEMGRGAGLGLASAYGIIKNHGGFINVYSKEGEGTTINVYLPASEKEIVEEKALASDVFKGSETVFLVDDEDMIVDVGEQLLEKLGYRTVVAGNGMDAIEIYKEKKNHIDMVILDMIMPEMDGGQIYDKLKEINPDVKVLLSSGYSINSQATEILERGCDGFIQKPFTMKNLSQKIREVLDKA
jgi:PAS domain S-box-containing protein